MSYENHIDEACFGSFLFFNSDSCLILSLLFSSHPVSAATFVSGLSTPTGIAIHPQQRVLYIKSGAGGTLWKVPILSNGSAGAINVVTDQFNPTSQINFDAAGNIYGIVTNCQYGDGCVEWVDNSGSVCRTNYGRDIGTGFGIETPGISSSRFFVTGGAYSTKYLYKNILSAFRCGGHSVEYSNSYSCGPFRYMHYRASRADLVGSMDNAVFSININININSGNCTPLVSNLVQPDGLAEDSSGNLYIADTGAGKIIKRTPLGQVIEIARNLYSPTGIVWDKQTGRLFVAETAANRVSVIPTGIALAGSLYFKVRSPSGGWSSWQTMPGGFKSPSEPAAVFDTNRNLYVFAHKADNTLWRNQRTPAGVWAGWKYMSMKTSSAPSAVAVGNVIYLYARGLDDKIWMSTRSTAGVWSTWSLTPMTLSPEGPEAAVDRLGNAYLFQRLYQ